MKKERMLNKEKIEPLKAPWKVGNYWKREAGIVVLITISGIVYNIGMLVGPVYQGKMIDALLGKAQQKEVLRLAFLFVTLIFLVQVFRYIKRFYIRRFANRTSATMRFMIYNQIIYKSRKEIEEENMGSLMTKAISDVDVCVEGMRKFTTEVFDTGILLISYLAVLMMYDWKITLFASAFVPIAMAIAEKLKKVIYKYTRAYRKTMSQMTQSTYDRMENAMLYRLYGREEENQRRYESLLDVYERDAIISNIWENAMQPIYNVIAMSGIVMVITLAGQRVIEGSFTVGIFAAYVSIFTGMAFKASKAAKLFNSVQKAMISWKRIKPYLEEYKKGAEEGEKGTADTLRIAKLHFSYEEDKEILSGIEVSLKAGEILGVSGPIASGKTTFGKLFLGNYAYTGSIQIGGYELSSLNEKERCQRISYLGHEPQLLSDTIYENITLGQVRDSDRDKTKAVREVLQLVCFEKDLEKMEDGIYTKVGNGGVCLSGGQQARIALARTLYHRKKILVLDDPFSAVDQKTEEEILKNIRETCKDSIIVLISHHLDMLKHFDQMLFIGGDGEKVEI